jgi:hypothetical protein
MSITSFYVLLAAMHSQVVFMPSAMVAQTIASMGHWFLYQNKWLHWADRVLSFGVFVWNILYLLNDWPKQSTQAIIMAAMSTTVFRVRVGVRDKAFAQYRLLYILPHTTFRFCAFWFVMLLHDQPWSWKLSVFYWFTGAPQTLDH